MPLTISNTTGDGIADPRLDTDIELPDSGTSVSVQGTVQAIGGSVLPLTGSPLTAPTAPVSGFIYWIIEANLTTGALAVVQSTSAMPPPDTGCIVLFQQTLSPANTDDALDNTDVTPDTF